MARGCSSVAIGTSRIRTDERGVGDGDGDPEGELVEGGGVIVDGDEVGDSDRSPSLHAVSSDSDTRNAAVPCSRNPRGRGRILIRRCYGSAG
jgi:hypothetical protein